MSPFLGHHMCLVPTGGRLQRTLCGDPRSHLHALSDPGAGDLVVVWGPVGHRDTANRPEQRGPGGDPYVPLGPLPFWPCSLTRRYQFPTPLCPPWVSEWGARGERVGVSLVGFCLLFFPRWLVNIAHPSLTRRPTMCVLSDGEHLTITVQIDSLHSKQTIL